MLNRGTVLAIALLFPFTAQAEPAPGPEIVVHWKAPAIPLGKVEGDQTYPNPPAVPLGFASLEVAATAPRGAWSLTGIKLEGNRVTVAGETASYRLTTLILRHVLVFDQPVRENRNVGGITIPVLTGRSERVRRETTIATHQNLGVTVTPNEGMTFPAFTLPSDIPLELVPDQNRRELRISIRDGQAFRNRMKEAVDASYGDDILLRTLNFRLDNVPRVSGVPLVPEAEIARVNQRIREELETRVNEGKPRLFRALRDALHREIDRPQFLERMAEALNRGLPMLPADDITQRLRATLTLGSAVGQFHRLSIGGTEMEPPASPVPDPAQASIAVFANEAGLNLVTATYLARFRGQRQLSRHYAPTDAERGQWAAVLGDLSGQRIAAENIALLSMEFPGPPRTRFTFTGSAESPRLSLVTPLTIRSRDTTVAPLDIPLRMTFRSNEGRLALQSVGPADSSGPPRGLQTAFQYNLLTILAARQLDTLPATYTVRLGESTIYVSGR